MLALAFWCAGRILGLIRATEGHPIRWVMLLYAIAALAAFAAAMSNSTLTVAESTGTARALFPVAAALGIGLLAVDGLESREQCHDCAPAARLGGRSRGLHWHP